MWVCWFIVTRMEMCRNFARLMSSLSGSEWTVQSKMEQLEAAKYVTMYRTKDKTAALTVQKEKKK